MNDFPCVNSIEEARYNSGEFEDILDHLDREEVLERLHDNPEISADSINAFFELAEGLGHIKWLRRKLQDLGIDDTSDSTGRFLRDLESPADIALRYVEEIETEMAQDIMYSRRGR